MTRVRVLSLFTAVALAYTLFAGDAQAFGGRRGGRGCGGGGCSSMSNCGWSGGCGNNYGGCGMNYSSCGSNYGGCGSNYGGCGTSYGGCGGNYGGCGQMSCGGGWSGGCGMASCGSGCGTGGCGMGGCGGCGSMGGCSGCARPRCRSCPRPQRLRRSPRRSRSLTDTRLIRLPTASPATAGLVLFYLAALVQQRYRCLPTAKGHTREPRNAQHPVVRSFARRRIRYCRPCRHLAVHPRSPSLGVVVANPAGSPGLPVCRSTPGLGATGAGRRRLGTRGHSVRHFPFVSNRPGALRENRRWRSSPDADRLESHGREFGHHRLFLSRSETRRRRAANGQSGCNG